VFLIYNKIHRYVLSGGMQVFDPPVYHERIYIAKIVMLAQKIKFRIFTIFGKFMVVDYG